MNVLPLLSLHSYSGFYNVDMQYKFHIYEIIVLCCTFLGLFFLSCFTKGLGEACAMVLNLEEI